MESQVEIRKLPALIQNLYFKGIPLLMLTNQNKALFIILINQKLCIKIEQTSENSGESVF